MDFCLGGGLSTVHQATTEHSAAAAKAIIKTSISERVSLLDQAEERWLAQYVNKSCFCVQCSASWASIRGLTAQKAATPRGGPPPSLVSPRSGRVASMVLSSC